MFNNHCAHWTYATNIGIVASNLLSESKMLHSLRRDVLFFDLALRPHPAKSDPIPLKELLPALKKMVDAGEAAYERDNGRRIMRLSCVNSIKTKGAGELLVMLLTLGDKDKSDPGFQDLQTGKLRILKKRENEGGALSTHVVVGLNPSEEVNYVYMMLIENVPGLGKTMVEAFFRHIFRRICKEEERVWKKEDGKTIMSWPDIELAGHQSERLKTALQKGGLQYIELVDNVEEDMGFDEKPYITTKRKTLSFSVRQMPKDIALNFLEKVKLWGSKNGYDGMRVRWKPEGQATADSAYLSTARQDVGETLFVKSAEIVLKVSLPECSEDLCEELVEKMTKLYLT